MVRGAGLGVRLVRGNFEIPNADPRFVHRRSDSSDAGLAIS